MNLGMKLNMSFGAGGTLYGPLSFRDEFTTARLAGAVDGTACEPGSGTRTVVDTESKLTIADGKLTFAGGKASPAYGDPGLWITDAITRVRGLLIGCKITVGDATSGIEFGLDTAKTGTLDAQRIRIASDVLTVYDGSTASPALMVPADSTDYYLLIILRDTGARFFVRTDTGYWKQLWHTTTNNTAGPYIGIANYSMAATFDLLRKPFLKWLPTPLLSDAFTAANGTTNNGRSSDGLGHLETTGLGSGGVTTWSGSSGAIQSNRLVITPTLGSELFDEPSFDNSGNWVATNWTISGGLASHSAGTTNSLYQSGLISYNQLYQLETTVNSVLAGNLQLGIGQNYSSNFSSTGTVIKTGRAVTDTFARAGMPGATWAGDLSSSSLKLITLSTCFNTVNLPTADITIECAFQRTTGAQAGVVLGLNDAGTSFAIAYHDGSGNIKLEICESGTYTTKSTVAATYGSGYALRVRRDGTEIWVWYNNVLIGTGPTTTLSAGENTNLRGTKAGCFSTHSGNSFDNVVIHYTGTNGEFNILNGLLGV